MPPKFEPKCYKSLIFVFQISLENTKQTTSVKLQILLIGNCAYLASRFHTLPDTEVDKNPS